MQLEAGEYLGGQESRHGVLQSKDRETALSAGFPAGKSGITSKIPGLGRMNGRESCKMPAGGLDRGLVWAVSAADTWAVPRPCWRG